MPDYFNFDLKLIIKNHLIQYYAYLTKKLS